MIYIRSEYIRELHNLLTSVSQTLYVVNHQTNATMQDKLKAIMAVEKTFIDIKRAMIYLINTEPKI